MSEPSPSTSGRSRPIGSPTWPRCSRRAATRSGAGAPTSGSAVATGRTRRRPGTAPRLRTSPSDDAGARAGRLSGRPTPSAGSASGRARTTSGWPFEDPRPGRRHAGLVDRVLRRLATVRGQGRRRGAPRRRRSTTPATTARRRSRRTRSTSGRRTRIPAANAFHGTLAMFERAGFTVVERRQWNADDARSGRSSGWSSRRPGRSAPASSSTAGPTLLRHPSRPWHRRPSGLTSVSPRARRLPTGSHVAGTDPPQRGGGSNDDESVPPHPMRCA